MVNIIKDGDLFTVPASILINPVNRAGISGAGLAKEFKSRFPQHQGQWIACNTFPMKHGDVFCIVFGHVVQGDQMIMYFPTKHHPKDKFSDIDLILANLKKLKYIMTTPSWAGITINMPALGCGLGGLDFEGVIKPLIIDMFQNEPYTINLFEPK